MTFVKKTAEYMLKGLRELSMSSETIVVFLCCYINSGKGLSLTDISRQTGLHMKTIKKHMELLVRHGMISMGDAQGRYRKRRIDALDFEEYKSATADDVSDLIDLRSQKEAARQILNDRIKTSTPPIKTSTPPSPSSINTSSSLVSSPRLDNNTSPRLETRTRTRGGEGYVDVTITEIRNDEDWKGIEKILFDYFEPGEIDLKPLTNKKRFLKLCDLYLDADFDFKKYVKWYSETKYLTKGFGFGLFLYTGIVSEYRAYLKQRRSYQDISRLSNSDSRKNGVRSTRNFLKKFE